jgi:hypothetical protein
MCELILSAPSRAIRRATAGKAACQLEVPSISASRRRDVVSRMRIDQLRHRDRAGEPASSTASAPLTEAASPLTDFFFTRNQRPANGLSSPARI